MDYHFVDVHFEREADRLKSRLIEGKILEKGRKIAQIKEQIKALNNELCTLVGRNIRCPEANVGDIVMDSRFHYVYVVNQKLELEAYDNGNP